MCACHCYFWRHWRNAGLEGLIMTNEPDFGAPAFPTETPFGFEDGMSLRDYFAAKAMHAIVSDPETQMNYQEIAIRAYQYANAMLEVREK